MQAPQALKSPAMQEIVAYEDSHNMGTNSTPQRVITTGVDRTIPVTSGISGTSTPYPSGISGTSAAPPYGGLWSPRIGNIQQSTSPDFRKPNELNNAVDRKLSNNLIVPPVSTQVFGDELSYSSSRDIYMQCRVNLATESINLMVPKFVNHGISTVESLNKSVGVWSPVTIIKSSPNITHLIVVYNSIGQKASAGEVVGEKSDHIKENYKTDFEIWIENSKLQFRRKNIERS